MKKMNESAKLICVCMDNSGSYFECNLSESKLNKYPVYVIYTYQDLGDWIISHENYLNSAIEISKIKCVLLNENISNIKMWLYEYFSIDKLNSIISQYSNFSDNKVELISIDKDMSNSLYDYSIFVGIFTPKKTLNVS